MRNKYRYQNIAAEKVLNDAMSGSFKAAVLAACPGAGKTTISHKIINEYLKINPNARILVLTEGQTTLMNQYLDELKNPNIDINFTYGMVGFDVQVSVGIPQNINKLQHNIDLIIIDEAHNWYLAPTVQKIIENLNPKHQVLMTGTPSAFTKWNDSVSFDFMMFDEKKYEITYISAEDLIANGIFSAVDLDVAKINNKKNATNTINKVLVHAMVNNYNLDKIMIACPNIAYAKKVDAFMKLQGRKVSLSTSKNDLNSKEIKEFKAGKTDVLIVVGRGILGFNDKEITALFDLRSSTNLNASYQLFARVLRTHPENIKKSYIRIGEEKDFTNQVETIHMLKALMSSEIFKGFTGKNLAVNAW